MKNRQLTPSQKRFILNRDGWCCNNCGYVPFHTFKDVPRFAKKSYQAFSGFTNELQQRSPIIFVKWDMLEDDRFGDINLDFCYLHGGELEFDHIVPICKSGSLNMNNIRALCKECHKIKSNMDFRYTSSMKSILSKYGDVICQTV